MNRMKKLLLVFLLFVNCLAYAFQATVTRIKDGDTFDAVRKDNDEKVTVRLYGIDCPEKDQKMGKEATDFTSKMIANREVTIEDMGRDRYGRILGIVTVDSDNLNEKLLENGLAWVYRKYCKKTHYYDLEKMARDAGIYIWSDTKAIAPWEWRKMSKKEKID